MFGMEHRNIDIAGTSEVDIFMKKIARELKSGLYSILILVSMSYLKRPTYGYEIIKTIEKLSGSTFRLKDATVYPVLKDFEKRGLVKGFWGETEKGPVRRYYELTGKGIEALSQAIEEWENEVSVVNRVIGVLRK